MNSVRPKLHEIGDRKHVRLLLKLFYMFYIRNRVEITLELMNLKPNLRPKACFSSHHIVIIWWCWRSPLVWEERLISGLQMPYGAVARKLSKVNQLNRQNSKSGWETRLPNPSVNGSTCMVKQVSLSWLIPIQVSWSIKGQRLTVTIDQHV